MLVKLCLTSLLSLLLLDQGEPKQPSPQLEKNAVKQSAEKETDPKNAKPQVADKAAESSKDDLIEVEKQIVDQTNAQRAHYGLPPLAVDHNLIQTARSHAAWMTNNRSLQHTTKPVGENIAMGQRNTDEAVSAWMASPGHRANILNNSYKRIGVAAYRTPDGTIYWCQQFLP